MLHTQELDALRIAANTEGAPPLAKRIVQEIDHLWAVAAWAVDLKIGVEDLLDQLAEHVVDPDGTEDPGGTPIGPEVVAQLRDGMRSVRETFDAVPVFVPMKIDVPCSMEGAQQTLGDLAEIVEPGEDETP